ncbi:hypothetical protein L1987_02905 [Smallanthus sonchifolius]|uniref:Uncharacterized protein n=1 Tax=Smallanthus sonchifolius TaxID=185202 RepID=A0ACB9K925_9ASTR|nr:hypothetical protein L1987_02905 [Smallanthus sonchifolius]
MGQIVCSNYETGSKVNGHHQDTPKKESENKNTCGFQMPLHYPRYKKEDYEKMPEWKLDCLLKEYGLPANIGDVNQKRKFAMGAFLWT